jgi:hypothetical protein
MLHLPPRLRLVFGGFVIVPLLTPPCRMFLAFLGPRLECGEPHAAAVALKPATDVLGPDHYRRPARRAHVVEGVALLARRLGALRQQGPENRLIARRGRALHTLATVSAADLAAGVAVGGSVYGLTGGALEANGHAPHLSCGSPGTTAARLGHRRRRRDEGSSQTASPTLRHYLAGCSELQQEIRHGTTASFSGMSFGGTEWMDRPAARTLAPAVSRPDCWPTEGLARVADSRANRRAPVEHGSAGAIAAVFS